MESSPRRTVLVSAARSIAVAIALGAGGGACGARSARGPPVSLDIALERAQQALCVADGVESPRALVAAVAPAGPCRTGDETARVRCYLARPDTTVQVARIPAGYRIRVAIPQLSDHVHDVTVRRSRGALTIEIDSRN